MWNGMYDILGISISSVPNLVNQTDLFHHPSGLVFMQ